MHLHQIRLAAPTGAVKAPCATILPYAPIPHALIADPRLTATDIRLVAILLRYCQRRVHCWPSVARLAADLGRSIRTVQYGLARLRAAGWVRSQPDGNPTGRVLILCWRDVAGGGGAIHCTGGVQSIAPRPTSPRVQPVAPEGDVEEKKRSAAPPRTREPAAPDPEATAALARLDALLPAHRDALLREAARRYGVSPKAKGICAQMAALILAESPGAGTAPSGPPGGPQAALPGPGGGKAGPAPTNAPGRS